MTKHSTSAETARERLEIDCGTTMDIRPRATIVPRKTQRVMLTRKLPSAVLRCQLKDNRCIRRLAT